MMHYTVMGPLSVLEHNEVKTERLSDVSVLNEVFWGLEKVVRLLFQRGI